MITLSARRVCARIAWAAVRFYCTLRSLLVFTWSRPPASVRRTAARVTADLDELATTRSPGIRKMVLAECLEHAEVNRAERRLAGRITRGRVSNAGRIRALVHCIDKRVHRY